MNSWFANKDHDTTYKIIWFGWIMWEKGNPCEKVIFRRAFCNWAAFVRRRCPAAVPRLCMINTGKPFTICRGQQCIWAPSQWHLDRMDNGWILPFLPATLPWSLTLRYEQNENLLSNLTLRKDLKIGWCDRDGIGIYVLHNVKLWLWKSIRDRLSERMPHQQGYPRSILRPPRFWMSLMARSCTVLLCRRKWTSFPLRVPGISHLMAFFGHQLVLIGCSARQGGYRRMAILEKVSCIVTGEGSLHVFRPWTTNVVQAKYVGLEGLAVRCSFTKSSLVTDGETTRAGFSFQFRGISMVYRVGSAHTRRYHGYRDGSVRNVQKWSVFQNTLKAHFQFMERGKMWFWRFEIGTFKSVNDWRSDVNEPEFRGPVGELPRARRSRSVAPRYACGR